MAKMGEAVVSDAHHQLFEQQERRMEQITEMWRNFPTRDASGKETILGYGEVPGGRLHFLEGLEKGSLKEKHVAQCLHNTYVWLRGLSEATRMTNVGEWEKFAFPIVSAVMGNLVAEDLVSVQPL